MTFINKVCHVETSLVVQWLRLWTSNAGDEGSIPGQGIKILHAARSDQKKKKKNFCVTRAWFVAPQNNYNSSIKDHSHGSP